MSAQEPPNTQRSTIDDLFGSAEDDDDLLASIGQSEDVDVPDHGAQGVQATKDDVSTFFPQKLSSPQHAEPDFADMIGATDDQLPHSGLAAPTSIPMEGDKDFSDLLAEFEAEGGELSPEAGDLAAPAAAPEDLKQELGGFAGGIEHFHASPASQAGASGFFAEDGGDDLFDSLGIGNGQSSGPNAFLEETPNHSPPSAMPEESPVPTLSIENESADVSLQSIFTEESDWLGDTTIEESYAIDRGMGRGNPALSPTTEDGNAPITFDVPEGWYDDTGNFQYYTAEEKEAVRQTMLGERQWDTGEPESPTAAPTPGEHLTAPYSPMLEAAHSENAARRTPVAEQQAYFGRNSYDAYAPPAPALNSSTSHSSYAPMSASTSSYTTSEFTPASTPYSAQGYASVAPAAPAMSSYDPYAPAPQPFAPPSLALSQSYSAIPPIAGPSKLAPPGVKPLPVQRMASNAYDPPLRPSKSFVRPVSAVPIAPFSPPALPSAPSAPAAPPAGPPRSTPSAPPGPPPRKGSTGSVQHSRQPSLGTPSLASQLDQLAEDSQGQDYNQYSAPKPPSRPPSAARPPGPPARNSFDPPLRPSSAARSASRASNKPTFSPPPPPTQTLHPTLSAGPPSRPASRGPIRRPSPMFEAPPLSTSRRSSQIYTGGLPPPPEGRILTPLPVRDLQVSSQEEHDWRDRSGSPVPDNLPEVVDPEGGNWNGIETYAQAPPPPPPVDTDPYAPSAYQAPAARSYEPESSMPTSPLRAAPAFNAYAPTSPPNTNSAPYSPYSMPPPGPPPSSDRTASWAPPRPPIPSFVEPIHDSFQPGVTSPDGHAAFGSSPGTDYFQTSKDHTYTPQQVLEQRPISEDPLGRCTISARNVPLAVFGFGGVIITAFPASAEDLHAPTHNRTPSYGYASGRGQLWIRKLTEVIEPAVLKPHEAVFPGPLVLEAATSKATAADKKKKDSVLAYLTARSEEIEKGLPYLKSSAKAARREEEGKLVVLKLLAAMVTGDGHLSGSPAVEDTVRAALQKPSTASAPTAASASTLSNSLNAPTRSSASTPQQLVRLSEMMAQGDKQSAAEFAADHGLWSHALLIASCVNQDFWKDIAIRFAASELGSNPNIAALKASYALFAGTTTDNVDALMAAANITQDPSADQWREVLSAVIFNGNPTQLSCLVDLGNRFMTAGLVNAAQACYILSPTSPFGDITLAAYEKPIMLTQDVKDEDAIIFAEIAEYARSLMPVPKGQELPIPGLPALLPYKLRRAWLAAEVGEVDRALRYCNAVEAATKIKNGPQLLSSSSLSSLEDLLERLTGTPSAAPSKGFGSRKASKPGISSWIEGRLTKFIAGEDDGSAAAAKPALASTKDKDAQVGPFSHFSTISPAPSTSGMSRNGSHADINGGYLGVSGMSARPSTFARQTSFGASSAILTPSHEVSAGGYGDYMSSRDAPPTTEEDEPTEGSGQDEEGEFINPMAALSLGPSPVAPSATDYAPKSYAAPGDDEEDEDDLGFGNKALSRNRTPRPEPASGENDNGESPAAPAKTETTTPSASPAKPEAAKSSGWLRGWWGKKEGEQQPSGPIKAKLGDDSSMVYDKDLKRWVVKGQKPDALPAAPPPPPRSQTVSPSKANRGVPAVSTPPPSSLSRSMGPGGSAPSSVSIPRSQSASTGLTTLTSLSPAVDSDTATRGKSSLAESITASDVSGGPPPPQGKPPGKPPLGPPIGLGAPPRPTSTTASIDDLLSRPPSKRPASVALRKGARNRYVDVFQPGQEGQGQ